MRSATKTASPTNNRSAEGLRIGIVVSRYHPDVTESMRIAAEEAFLKAGGVAENLMVVHVPGTWELTAACNAMATLTSESPDGPDALVAIGCVISGETTHDQYICHSVTQGLT